MAVTRADRPRGDTRVMKQAIMSCLTILRKAGRQVTVNITLPPRKRNGTPSDAKWLENVEAPAGVKWTPYQRSFRDAHLVCMSLEDIRNARASWLVRIDGAPAILPPGRDPIWLGPYYHSIFGQGIRCVQAATDFEPDPRLWPHYVDAEGRTIAHDHATHRRAYIAIMGENAGSPMDMIWTGRAAALAGGASVDYVMRCSNLVGHKSELTLEDLEERALLAQAQGIFRPRLLPDLPSAPPGFQHCIVCMLEQPETEVQCGNSLCRSPLGTKPGTPSDRLRLTLLRMVDDMMRSRGEKPADRERHHFALACNGRDLNNDANH